MDGLKRLALGGGNPYDPARRNYLLDGYRDRTITLGEARELQGYLQEDAQSASVGTGLLLILAALAGIAALIYLLTRSEE